MTIRNFAFIRRSLGQAMLVLVAALPFMEGALAAEAPSLEAFAMRPLVRDVDLSPSGGHVAVMRLLGPGQNYVVDVYETAGMDQDPYTLGSEHMDIIAVDWANDERLLVRTRQPVEVPGRRVAYNTPGIGLPGMVKTYAFKLLSVGLDGGRWVELPSKSGIARFGAEVFTDRLFSPGLVSRLPEEEDWVLVEWLGSGDSGTELFKVNVNNGQTEPVFHFSRAYGNYTYDRHGNVRTRDWVSPNDNSITIQFRTLGEDGSLSDWNDWFTWDVDSRRFVTLLGFAPEDDNQAYVRWAKDRDTEGIYLFDLMRPQQEPELLFATESYDAASIVTACISQQCVDGEEAASVVGFYYVGQGPEIYYTDEQAYLLQQSIDAVLPAENFNRIHDRAANDKYIVIHSIGPREPGRYYLLSDQQRLQPLGQAAAIEPEQLGERRVVHYEARDGMQLNAVLTLPTSGEAPYPTVVNPHGGPQSRDSLHWNSSFWDEWPQVLATRGYAVLQPNFRGSTGFGYDYFAAGDQQWGYKMQDDVDDSMAHLVEQGIADPERLAIFGWSYGGYSAMVGSMRDPNMYRCAIAGAGVSSMELISKDTRVSRFRDVIQVSQGGLSPIQNMDDVNIPVLLVHGDRDLIVPIQHSDLFAQELEERGKPFKYLKLEDAGHTVDTLGYQHSLDFYGAMLDFLADDCGLQTLQTASLAE